MPGRDDFDSEIFEGNPFEGLNSKEVYRKLRWGNEPDEIFTVNAPESMATLGTVARIDSGETTFEFDESEAPFLAVGTKSNMLYIVPRDERGNPQSPIPSGPYEEIGEITRLDYYSNKGDEECYFFHEHESPFPILVENPETGIQMVIPVDNDGSRSYAVDEEGVIG